ATQAAEHINLFSMDKNILSAHEIGEAASKVAVMPAVRRTLVDVQRKFANKLPSSVLDGRDIGTVVCPDAAIKLFVTASPEVRARQRVDEITTRGLSANLEEIVRDIKQRDERDMSRNDSPLRPAADAHLLDTSEMSIETAFLAAKKLIDHALAQHSA